MDDTRLIPRRLNYSDIVGEQEKFISKLLQQAFFETLELVPKGNAAKQREVLDVGAGECPLKSDLESRGYRYRSLDITQNASGTIDYVAALDQILPEDLLAEPAFDLVVCTEVLEHVANWNSAFGNLNRLLRTNGYCLVTAPFFYMLHEEPFDFWRPTNHALNAFAVKFGFEVVLENRLGDGWDTLGTLLCSTSICRKRKSLVGLLATLPVYAVHKILKYAVSSPFLRRNAELQTRFYLSNMFLLRKRSDFVDERFNEPTGLSPRISQ